MLVLIGAALIAMGLVGTATASAANIEPKLTATKATFHIPANSPTSVTWTLSLYEIHQNGSQTQEGKISGTSGVLTLRVPQTSSCYFQVDVQRGTTWYSGFKQTVAFCGGASVSSTTTSSTTSTTMSTTTTTKAKSTTTTTKTKTKGGSGGKKGSGSSGAKTGSNSGGSSSFLARDTKRP